MPIEWETTSSHICINPAYSLAEQQKINLLLMGSPFFPGHVWLATSGSVMAKWVGLSKQAILTSAQAVNQHVDSHSSDRWVQTLPDFHIGGIGVWARGYLNGAAVLNFREQMGGKWSAEAFCSFVEHMQGTLTALVPTQIYDLVRLKIQSPRCLRAVLVGGGALPPELYHQAIQLGWHLLPTYGLTECASQVATAELDTWESHLPYPKLKILPHIQIKPGENKRLAFKGDSLFTTYSLIQQETSQLWDPKIEGWFTSEDQGEIEGSYLSIQGRVDHVIKIGGESVDLAHLERLLHAIRFELNISHDMTLVAYPDFRLGHVIHLALAHPSKEAAQAVLDHFHQKVLPFEKIRSIHCVPFIPRSALFKVCQKELLAMILQSK